MAGRRWAALVLEDGRAFVGLALGAAVTGEGEVVFNTAMTGYQEVLTDPSYAGQMVCMTYPMQGNYGVRDADAESSRPWARALITRWACPAPSHHSREASLDAYLERWGLMTPQWAAHMIRFFNEPTSRSYVITYPAGRELCRYSFHKMQTGDATLSRGRESLAISQN